MSDEQKSLKEQFAEADRWLDRLFDACPRIFPDRKQPACGISGPGGWDPIIFDLFVQADKMLEQNPKLSRIHIAQVKEKFGGLRVYFSYETKDTELEGKFDWKNPEHDWFGQLLSKAEDACRTTCCDCGSPNAAPVSRNYWYTVLCAACIRFSLAHNVKIRASCPKYNSTREDQGCEGCVKIDKEEAKGTCSFCGGNNHGEDLHTVNGFDKWAKKDRDVLMCLTCREIFMTATRAGEEKAS